MLEQAHEPIMQSAKIAQPHKLSDLWNHNEVNYKDFNLKNVVSACKEVFGQVE